MLDNGKTSRQRKEEVESGRESVFEVLNEGGGFGFVKKESLLYASNSEKLEIPWV